MEIDDTVFADDDEFYIKNSSKVMEIFQKNP